MNISAEAGDGATALTVINERTFDLPGTGGKGVMMLYIGGGILIAAAVVFILLRRKA